MSEIYDKAMDKLRDELAADNSAGVQQVGEYMTARLMADAELAEAILVEGKTLKGAFQAIHDYASKHRSGNFAFVPPEKAFEIVAGYYILPAQDIKSASACGFGSAGDGGAAGAEPLPDKNAPVADALDLDRLLGL